MSYVITHTNGKTFNTLGEGVLDNSLGISLIGQNYHNYGQLIANNFLQMLEHQASDTPPPNPVAGQIWWDTDTHVLSFFDGNKFKPCSSSAVAANPPMSPLKGDQWWDTVNDQLKIFTGSEWEVVGPSYPKGQAFTGLLPVAASDTQSTMHIISELQVNGVIVAIINKDAPFILSSPISGLTTLGTGITLTTSASIFGTTTNSHQLNNVPAANYLRKDAVSNTLTGDLTIQGLSGLTVGATKNLTISTDPIDGSQIIWSDNSDILLMAGTESLRANVTSNTFTISSAPTLPNSIATKTYVDSTVDFVNTNNHEYTDLSIASLVNLSPLSTLSELSAAIDNDALYYVNENARRALKADLLSPTFTGIPTSPTPANSDNSTRIATTAYVKANIETTRFNLQTNIDNLLASATGFAPIESPDFTGIPLTTTPVNLADDSKKIVNTSFLKQKLDALNSNIQAALLTYAPIQSPDFKGIPVAPTPDSGDKSRQLATTKFVDNVLTNGLAQISAGASTFTSLTVSGSLLPISDNLSDLGSVNKKFRNINATTLNINGSITPTVDNTVDIGSSGAKIKTVYTSAISVNNAITPTTPFVDLGTAVSQFRSVYANNIAVSTSLLPTATNTIDVGSATFRFRNVYGNAMSSNYADLAENYTSDGVYLPGTVVVFGGKEEVTISDQYCDSRIAGVVSTNPAYLMNDQVKGVSVALTGKVPCKVIGPVRKGDLIVNSAFAGVARAILTRADWAPGCVIGKSLESSADTGIRTVMVSVGRF
jgi:hypothetical protein